MARDGMAQRPMRQIFFSGTGVPLAKLEDIIPLLGKKIHWREDRSAYEAAYSWFDAPGIPKSVRTVIETDRVFVRAVLDKAFFEKQTKLDAYRRPRQTDVLAILQTKSGVGISDVPSPRKIPKSSRPQ